MTAQSVIDLLQVLCTKHPETTKFLIYLDNARYQQAKVLKAWIATVQATQGVEVVLEHLPGVFAESEPERAVVEVSAQEGVAEVVRHLRGDASGGGPGAGQPEPV